MPVASLPSPIRGVWHLGPLPVRGYALCIVAGVVVALWLTASRYAKAGGRRDVILDVAAWAVPFGLIGAAAGAVIHGGARLVPSRPDLWSAARVWDGAVGVPGAVGLGALGAWIACRRAGVRLGPVAGAAAPATAFGAAVGCLGGWFSQTTYGRPSSLPWAVQIAPGYRVPGYENFATFEPVFGYEAVWCAAAGLAVIWAARRFALTGDRAFALAARADVRRPVRGGITAHSARSAVRRPAGRPVGGTGYGGRRGRLSVPDPAPARAGCHRPGASQAAVGLGKDRNLLNLGHDSSRDVM